MVHARNTHRAAALAALTERGAQLVVADLTDRDAVRDMANELAASDSLDAVIPNASVWSGCAVYDPAYRRSTG